MQVKCGSKGNYDAHGRELNSFVYGELGDVMGSNYLLRATKHYDLLLTGYEVENGILSPYVLLFWPIFIRQIYKNKNIRRSKQFTSTGKFFAWSDFLHIPKAAICCSNVTL